MIQVASHSIRADVATILAELGILLCLPLWAVMVLIAQLVFAIGVPMLMVGALIGPVRRKVLHIRPTRPRE